MPVCHAMGLDEDFQWLNLGWIEKNLDPSQLVYIGIRELDGLEKKTLEKYSISFYGPVEIEELGGIGKVWNKIEDQL